MGSGGAGNEVAFSVHKNGTNQTVTSTTWTKLTWSTEEFDSNSNFSSSRFTPTVAGEYLITGSMFCLDNTSWCETAIYKNGSTYKKGAINDPAIVIPVTAIVDMNGSTDYIELYGYNAGGTTIHGSTNYTYFTGTLISGSSGGSADNLGNHTATQNIQLDSNYLSGDGDNEGIRIDSSGNVGIGTTAPSSALHVYSSQNQPVVIETPNANTWLDLKSTAGTWSLGANSSNQFSIYGDRQGTPSVRFVLDSSGNVGIGTASPGKKLSVEGSDNNFIELKHPSRSGTWYIEHSGVNSENLLFAQNDGSTTANSFYAGRNEHVWFTAGTEKMRVNSSGNVGISTTTPEAKQDIIGDTQGDVAVHGSEVPALILQQRTGGPSNDYAAMLEFRANNGADIWSSGAIVGKTYSSFGGGLSFFTQTTGSNDPAGRRTVGNNLSETMTLTPTGNVGIGTTSPGAPLHIGVDHSRTVMNSNLATDHDLFISNSDSTDTGVTSIGFGKITSGAQSNGAIALFSESPGNSRMGFYTESSNTNGERLTIGASGNVGIGTTSPGVKLDVNGQIATGDTTNVFNYILNNVTGNRDILVMRSDTGGDSNNRVAWIQHDRIDSNTHKWNFWGSNEGAATQYSLLTLSYDNGGGNVGIGTRSP